MTTQSGDKEMNRRSEYCERQRLMTAPFQAGQPLENNYRADGRSVGPINIHSRNSVYFESQLMREEGERSTGIADTLAERRSDAVPLVHSG